MSSPQIAYNKEIYHDYHARTTSCDMQQHLRVDELSINSNPFGEFTSVIEDKVNTESNIDLSNIVFKKLYFDDIQSYLDRLQELREDAIDENIEVNENSVAGFRNFLGLVPKIVRGGLFLTQEGNLVATWDDNSENSVSLEFLDENKIMYIMFAKNSDGRNEDEANYADIDDVLPKICKFNLVHLLTDE